MRAASPATASRIGVFTGVCMILFALGVDGIQAFLNLIIIGVVLNWIINIPVGLTFWVWFHLLGISMSEAKGMRTLIFLGMAFGFEFMPLINTLPGWTALAVGAMVNEYGSSALERVPLMKRLIRKKKEK